MLRRSAALSLLALGAFCALTSISASATRPSDADIVSVDTYPFSAVVKWHVDDVSRVVLEVGLDDRYGIWSPTTFAHGESTSRTTLAGLEPATSYRFRVVARWRDGMTSEARGSFRTDPWPGSTAASAVPAAAEATAGDGSTTSGSGSPFVLPTPAPPPGVTPTQPSTTPPSSSPLPSGTPSVQSSAPLRVNGNAVFPRMVWRQCPTYYPTSLSAGINLFLGVECTNTDDQFARLAGRAMSTVDANTPGISGPGQVGWHYRDEADVAIGDAAKLPRPHAAGRVTFLTLTDHFSQRAAPPPNGKKIYPAFFDSADVIGFDTYPGRGPLFARADRQRLLDAARARLPHAGQADLPVDRGGADGTLPLERGPDPGGRARRDLARDRRRRTGDRLFPRLVGGEHPLRGAPHEP
jgi:hypothetical protein